jgi:hypothetical protein
MNNVGQSLLRLYASVLLLVTSINLGILGIIICGFTVSHRIEGAPGQMVIFSAGMALIAIYLAMRIKWAGLRIPSADQMPLFGVAMILSLLLPFSIFLLVRSREAVIEMGPMVFAQSIFMCVALAIKMHTGRRTRD